jgi:hypothetical protein
LVRETVSSAILVLVRSAAANRAAAPVEVIEVRIGKLEGGLFLA